MARELFEPTTVREDLKRLERAMKRLSVGYEMFLNQTVKWPPQERKQECEAIVRHYLKNPPRQTADRFLFHNLVHRYRTNLERWSRRQRSLETSGEIGPQNRNSRRERAALEDPTKPYTLMALRVKNEDVGGEQLRDLYTTYRNARRSRGLAVSKLGYAPFANSIGEHLDSARRRSKGRELELRVDTVDGKVRIAVRPVKSGSATDEDTGGTT